MNDTAYDRIIRALRERNLKVTENGHRANAQCPAHDDEGPSLVVTGQTGRTLLYCHTGCATADVLAELELTLADLYDERSAEYRYPDGRVIKRLYRDGKKTFVKTAGPDDGLRALYHGDRLTDAIPRNKTVFLVEGEADVHAIEEAGGMAVTAPHGAKSFHKADVEVLRDRWVTVIVDRDDAGAAWAEQVTAKLEGVAAQYRFRQARYGKDASDHIAAGGALHDTTNENGFLPWEPPEPDKEAEEAAEREAYEHALHRKLRDLRALDEARDILALERHSRTWVAPESFGTLTHELTIPAPDIMWRINGMLGAGHNALLVATRKVGKTTMVNHAVRCLADGDRFLGRFDTVPVDGGIAVFNYEVGAAQYRDWLRDVGIVNTDKIHLLHLRGKRLPLADPSVRAWVTKWLRERGIKAWIVDPYSRAAVGSVTKGNDEMDVATFLDHLDVVKADAGVEELIMPAHTPKAKVESGEESANGSQRLEGWPDALWYMVKDETGARFLRAEGRDVDVPEEQLAYDETTRALTLGGWDRRTAAANRDVDQVRVFVGMNAGCTQNAIQAEMGWGPARTSKAVLAAHLRKEPGPGRATLHYLV